MSIFGGKWQEVPPAFMHSQFLNAGNEKEAALDYLENEGILDRAKAESLTGDMNFDDVAKNYLRLHALVSIRARVIGEIPPDTRWNKVQLLVDSDLAKVNVIASEDRVKKAGPTNELLDYAARVPQIKLETDPENWAMPILWGHSQNGPFSIIEGNNRLVAYAQSGRKGLSIPVCIGISSNLCLWHRPDRPNIPQVKLPGGSFPLCLMNHMWR